MFYRKFKNIIHFFNWKKNREWRENHILYWKKPLELDISGFSYFQIELREKLEKILNNHSILFAIEITEHADLNDRNRAVKMITLILDGNSKFWIYRDMAELSINNEHQIYEEWGYLKPEDLIKRYLNSTKKLLNQKN